MAKRADEFLTMTEVAKLAQLTRQRIHVIAQSGRLPHKKLGNNFLVFKRRDVEAWLQSRRLATQAA